MCMHLKKSLMLLNIEMSNIFFFPFKFLKIKDSLKNQLVISVRMYFSEQADMYCYKSNYTVFTLRTFLKYLTAKQLFFF